MTDQPTSATIIDGRYKVIGRIGSGGMADVYGAEDLQLGRKVALKLLHRRFAEDAEFVERFRREASAAAGLQHPHVVSVYDRGEWDGTYYIAMAWLEGRSLKALIQQEAPLDPDRATDLTIQILRAARFAHKRGVIHRDLKPHNVIVDEGPPERATVTDFGIARAGASDMTQTGSIMGTAQYLSPEQAEGKPVTAASDLYSIGIILYELLTGRVPFEGESAVTIALKQVNQPPVPPSASNAAVSPALESVVLRALEKDPQHRFPDADAFITALEQARDGVAQATGAATTVLAPAGAAVAAAHAGAPAGPARPFTEEVLHVEDRGPYPPPDDGSGDGGRRWWIALLVGLVVATLLLGGVLLLGKDKVEVPNVVGVPQAEAELALKRQGLSTDVTLKEIATKPKGEVIGQDPGGGARIAKGDVVQLTVSAGPGTARVPVLAGQGRRAAARQLRNLGFQVHEDERFDDTITTDHVIDTQPAAGQELDRGSTVTLLVSLGKERVLVPGVRDQKQEDAETALTDAGFQVRVREEESTDAEPGTVLKQDPAGGTRAQKGSTVTITVAQEPAEVDVPDVVGMDRDEATETLSGEGFRVRTIEQDVTNLDDDGRVLDQDPADGKAKKGDRVTITVGHFNPDLNPDPGAGDEAGTTPADPGAEVAP